MECNKCRNLCYNKDIYVAHVIEHFKIDGFAICNINKCPRRFENYNTFKQHCRRNHKTSLQANKSNEPLQIGDDSIAIEDIEIVAMDTDLPPDI